MRLKVVKQTEDGALSQVIGPRPPEALVRRGITSVSSNGAGGVRLPKGVITRYFGRELVALLEVRKPKPEAKRRRYLGGEPKGEGEES